MNRLERDFSVLRANHQKAFVPYIMAGDGGLETLEERLKLLEEFGATAIEIGVPFSDPVADGPTIQRAGLRALANGTTLKKIIAELEKARNNISIPLILMTYVNPIYAYGIKEFCDDIKRAGVDGCIIPDLPLEEEELIAPLLEGAEIVLIRLVTLTTPQDRINQIASRSNGFLYAVTVKGITGVRNEYDQSLIDFLVSVKGASSIPVLAGFGVSDEEQIRDLTNYCDGVIVGSRIIDLLETNDMLELEKLMTATKKIEKHIL
jgi:tryptophan synthase alpha chain